MPGKKDEYTQEEHDRDVDRLDRDQKSGQERREGGGGA